jgi:L-serine dehydratase
MAKIFYPDFFNDVFGPIMQPGSSSNFAGTARVGRIARHVLTSEPVRARILFHKEDREFTALGNMNEDLGYLGGILDFAPDDPRLYDAHALAREKNLSYEFAVHPDPGFSGQGVAFELEGAAGDRASLIARSVGGGMVTTYSIEGFPIQWQADTYGVLSLHPGDRAGKEAAAALDTLGRAYPGDLVQGAVYTREDGASAAFAELQVEPDKARTAALPGMADVRFLPALLPIVTTNKRKPQLFRTIGEWRDLARTRGISFFRTALEYEKNFSAWEEEKILAYFENIAAILDNQIHALERKGCQNVPDTPLLPIYGKNWATYTKNGKPLSDTLTGHILVHAFSTNAKIPGVKIVPGPMGTGGGYLFSALDAVREERGYSREKLIEGLVIAAALGALAYTHTSASGSAGCAGESGVCCAMAAGAITQMAGGDGVQVENAASMALQANIGIPCDPIPGGREFPCITRTLRTAITAPLYADLALSGIDPLVPYHEVLLTLEKMRQNHGDFLCGPECGLLDCPTARKCAGFLSGDLMEGKMRYEAKRA